MPARSYPSPALHQGTDMSLIEKAVWYIEWRRGRAIELQDIADACGVSRFHLSRVFQGLTGHAVMAYTRKRRLSEAARHLVRGSDDILQVALDAGYGSHEAFTRAFRDQFGLTPMVVRAARSIETLELVEPFTMDASLFTELKSPRSEDRPAFHVAGLSERYSFETNHGIPALWQRFAPYVGDVPGQAESATYGICYNGDGEGSFDYMAGVEVANPDDVPGDLTSLTIPGGRYAVFTHSGHISDIRKTVYTIWNRWLPEADVAHVEGPDFERYDDRFDARTGEGDVEIWIPVR